MLKCTLCSFDYFWLLWLCLSYNLCQDMQGIITDGSVLGTELAPLGKGAGKGDLGKGGKGNGKGKPEGVPQPRAPKSEEELLEDAFCKVRRMRDCCGKVMSDMEKCLNSLKKSKFWSKAAQKDAMQYLMDMEESSETLHQTIPYSQSQV